MSIQVSCSNGRLYESVWLVGVSEKELTAVNVLFYLMRKEISNWVKLMVY